MSRAQQTDADPAFAAAAGYAACWQCPMWKQSSTDHDADDGFGFCTLDRFRIHCEMPACGRMRSSIEANIINTERAHMYEYVRTLNASQFAELYRRNIAGEGQFDDLVKAAMVERANRRHNKGISDSCGKTDASTKNRHGGEV